MKQFSKEYKKQFKQLMRNRSYCRILFKDINTHCATDGTWVDNGALDYSNKTQLDNIDYEYKDTIGNLDLNRWLLNNNCVVEKKVINDGYIADKFSGEQTLDNDVVLTRQFSKPYDLPGLTLVFDSRLETFPKEIKVSYYNSSTLIKEETFIPTDYIFPMEYPCLNVDKIVITISKALPYSHFRLEKVIFGLYYLFTNEVLTNVKQEHDVDPLARRVPTEKVSFTIIDKDHKYDPDNPQGVYTYIDKHAPIEISYGYTLKNGSVEWLRPDCYILNGRPTISNNLATFTGYSYLNNMSGTYYKDVLGTKSLYDMAEDILEDANLTPFNRNENPWYIDDTLKTIYTKGVLPIDTHINCLQIIAHAGRCRLYTDDTNKIHIEPFAITTKDSYKGTYQDNGHLPYSSLEDLDKDIVYSDTYATLELNRLRLDNDTQIIKQDNTPKGFVSDKLSKEDGTFDTNPILTRTFDIARDLGVVKLYFDRVLEEYPRQVEIRYYDVNDVLLDTQNEIIDDYEFTFTSTLALHCKKIEIEFIKTLPYSYIRIEGLSFRENDFMMNFTTIKQKTEKISKIDELKNVKVNQYSFKEDENPSEIYKQEGTTIETLHLELDSVYKDITITVTGGSVTTEHKYARALDLEFSSGTKDITITGTKLDEVKSVLTYVVSDEGEDDEEDNLLITSKEMADALASHTSNYIVMRNTYDVTYRGNPELETGDLIGLQTPYTDSMDAIVLTDTITFNGSLSGTAKLKGLV